MRKLEKRKLSLYRSGMKKLLLLSCACLLCPAKNTMAQTTGGWEYTLGAGIMTTPTYMGDDEYQVLAVPSIRVAYEDKFFASIQKGAGYNLINTDQWRAGPIARLDFGRDEDGNSPFSLGDNDSNDLRGLNEIDTAVELGAFIEYNVLPFSLSLEVRQAVGGHEGLVGTVAMDYKGKAQLMDKTVIYSFGPEINFADSNYHEAYFSVNAAESVASGLPQYDADAGVLSYGLGGSAIMPITENLSTVFFAGYSMLGEESADSSLVEQRGSEHQGSAGLFLNYTF